MVVTKTNPARKKLARILTAKRDVMDWLVKGICVLVVKVKKLPLTFQELVLKEGLKYPVRKIYRMSIIVENRLKN